MEIKEEYIRNNWERIVSDQTCGMYQSDGYEVSREVLLDRNLIADMVIEKNGKKTIIEILSRLRDSKGIMRLKKWAKEHGYDFKLVYANYAPIERKLEFENFNYLFVEYLNDNHPDEFDEFGSNTNAEDVLDVEFYSVKILKDSISISGICTIELNSRLDNDDDDDDTDFVYYVPCKFDVVCIIHEMEWSISDVNVLEIDTSQLDS